ncbi:hypothetical protein [Streptomyces sp. NPDC003077]|uniref:hypothetical protein n=1 Tax=Streptomyces sp. NPDC003077 TaxID=3154443 RepID=UPI0033BE20B0
MTDSLSPAERLLTLGTDFTRYHDTLRTLTVDGAAPITALRHQIPATQDLAKGALAVIDALNGRRMYHSAGVRAAYARIRQLAHLTTDAADHLLDRDSILTGAAADGEQPRKYYDFGDGYCSYDFFAKCPHRMACARCPFYVPQGVKPRAGSLQSRTASTSARTGRPHRRRTRRP